MSDYKFLCQHFLDEDGLEPFEQFLMKAILESVAGLLGWDKRDFNIFGEGEGYSYSALFKDTVRGRAVFEWDIEKD